MGIPIIIILNTIAMHPRCEHQRLQSVQDDNYYALNQPGDADTYSKNNMTILHSRPMMYETSLET